MSESGNDGRQLGRGLFLYCHSDLLSEEGLRQIIERHGFIIHHDINDYEFFFAACGNTRVTEGIIQCLLEYFPGAASASNDCGHMPLHWACNNPNMTLKIIQLLIDAEPASARSACNDDWMPLHYLCTASSNSDEMTAIDILKLFIEKCPEVVRRANNKGSLPIHLASGWRSPEFCRVLIEAYPGSMQIEDAIGALPLHLACAKNSLPVVECLYQQYPGAIDHSDSTSGFYPIQVAAASMSHRDDPAVAVKIVQFLLDCDPNQKLKQPHVLGVGWTLLHLACDVDYNDSSIEAGLQMIKILFDAHPAFVRSVNNEGLMPLHTLCSNGDEATALQNMEFLLEKFPEAAKHATNKGYLPIHIASVSKSPGFCRVLIEAYPESLRITDDNGLLPLHHACMKGSLATVEYLYRLFTNAINHPTSGGFNPIHYAMYNPASVQIIQFLLDCDPNQKLKQLRGKSLIHFACYVENNGSNVEASASIHIIKALFDAHPEAIENNRFVRETQQMRQQVQSFINGELVYARQAQDLRLMNTPDEHGQLPLHRALQNNVRLGSIKLLVKGNPSAVRSIDDNGALPLHVACEHHDSANVVEYLLGLAHITRDAIDSRGNTTLHYACRGAKYDAIALLVEKYGAASVSKRNAHGKLPIDLLWESNEVSDRESVEYMGSVFQLLKAYPEIVMNFDARAIQKNQDGTGKKRKYGSE